MLYVQALRPRPLQRMCNRDEFGIHIEREVHHNVPSKDKRDRRKALIEATIRSIVEVGVTETSVTNIVKRADVSRGMLHQCFENKDALLVATAKFFSEEYYRKLHVYLEIAGNDPITKLIAMIDADLGEELLNVEAVVVWNALRSLAHTNMQIRIHTTTRDKELLNKYREIYEELLGPDVHDETRSSDFAAGTIALLEGMWSDFFLYPNTFNRKTARRIVLRLIQGQILLSANRDIQKRFTRAMK